jgi:hypothetical protein
MRDYTLQRPQNACHIEFERNADFFLSEERDGIVPGQQLCHEFEFIYLVTSVKQ